MSVSHDPLPELSDGSDTDVSIDGLHEAEGHMYIAYEADSFPMLDVAAPTVDDAAIDQPDPRVHVLDLRPPLVKLEEVEDKIVALLLATRGLYLTLSID
jgi:hypothetical protein